MSIILQPIVNDPKNPSQQTPSKLKPQMELSKAEFLVLADHGRSIMVDGQPTTGYGYKHGRYIVAAIQKV